MSQPQRGMAGWGEWGPWVFVAGVAAYLAAPREPSAAAWCGGLAAALVLAGLARRRPSAIREGGALAVILLLAGAGWAGFVAHRAPQPLAEPIPFAKVEGRVESLELRYNGVRAILSGAEIAGLPGTRTLRVLLPARFGEPRPGARIAFTARLSPPLPPVHPDAFDLPRRAWFQGIAGMGYAIAPWRQVAPPPDDFGTAAFRARVEAARQTLRARILAAFPPGDPRAGVAVALSVGDAGAVDRETLQNFRESGLAHMLAISGLHMGLFAGLAFLLVRRSLALVPGLALNYPIKKWAALAALLLTTLYLLISGGSVPTQRAWMMTSAALVAVMLDRSPFSLRLVGVAAAAVALIDPEAVLGPSFQMSFGAVLALVAAYRSPWMSVPFRALPPIVARPALALAGTFATTIVATVATAPFALYHFGQVAVHALPANLLSVPVLGFWVMPWGMLAGFLTPFGLEALPLHAMALGIGWIDRVAATVAAWPNHLLLARMPDLGLALCAAGGLWLCLGFGRSRLAALAAILAGFAAPWFTTPPDLLISPGGAVVAVRTDDGYAATGGRSAFVRSVWHGRTGLPVESNGWNCDAEGCVAAVAGRRVARAGVEGLSDDCAEAQVVVARFPVSPEVRAACGAAMLFDAGDLTRAGAIAAWFGENDEVRLETVAMRHGGRPWGQGGGEDDGDDQ